MLAFYVLCFSLVASLLALIFFIRMMWSLGYAEKVLSVSMGILWVHIIAINGVITLSAGY